MPKKPPTPLESEVQKLCFDWLNTLPMIRVWRQNSGAFVKAATDTTKRRFIRAGQKGSCDLTGIGPVGIRVEIEMKRLGEVPSDDQNDWMDRIRLYGGIAFYADSIEMCVSKLREEFRIRNWPWLKHWEPL